jgi:hypothetical protein
MRNKISPINIHVVKGTDQPVFNLVLYGKFKPIRPKLLSYWSVADDSTIAIHYCSGYAPWIEKEDPGMDAYTNPKLGRVCHEIYKENLEAFPSLFPKVS